MSTQQQFDTVLLVFDLVREAAQELNKKKIVVAVEESTQAAFTVGGSVLVGGLLAGPFGIAVGGLLGIGVALKNTKDFQSLPEIFDQMNEKEKRVFAQVVLNVAAERGIRLLVGKVQTTVIEEITKAALERLNFKIKQV